jgi:hypothetical protein
MTVSLSLLPGGRYCCSVAKSLSLIFMRGILVDGIRCCQARAAAAPDCHKNTGIHRKSATSG